MAALLTQGNSESNKYRFNTAFLTGSDYYRYPKEKRFNKTLKRMIKLQNKDGKLPFSENSVIEFGDDEIFETTENSNSHIKYDELTNVYFTDDEMYLYTNSQQAFIIPYSQLGDDKEKVVDFIKQKTDR